MAAKRSQSSKSGHKKSGRKQSEPKQSGKRWVTAIPPGLEKTVIMMDAVGDLLSDEENQTRLLVCLLAAGLDVEARELSSSLTGATSALALLARVIVEFREHGGSELAAKWAVEMDQVNPYLVPYLLGTQEVPRGIHEGFVAVGSKEEASNIAQRVLPAFSETPGATIWLRNKFQEHLAPPKPSLDDRRDEIHALLAELQVIPASIDSWRISVRPVPTDGDTHLFLLTSPTGQELILTRLVQHKPTTEDLIDFLLEAAQQHDQRAKIVMCEDPSILRRMETSLKTISIKCQRCPPNPQLDAAIGEYLADLNGRVEHSELDESQLGELPQTDDVWMVDVVSLRTWIKDDNGHLHRPLNTLVVDVERGTVLGVAITITPAEAPDLLWKTMAGAMLRPADHSEPGRPIEIQFRSQKWLDLVQPQLESLGIACCVNRNFQSYDAIIRSLDDTLGQDSPAALLDQSGVELQDVAEFFHLACEFRRKTPWKSAPGDRAIEVSGGRWTTPWFISVMGQSGMVQGLACYFNWKDFTDLFSGRKSQATSLAFFLTENQGVGFADLDAMDLHGWPVANAEAYPALMTMSKSGNPGTPSADQLRRMNQLLRMIPDFAKSRLAKTTVETPEGPVSLTWTTPVRHY